VNVSAVTSIGTDIDWTVISAGPSYTCGIRAGQLHCWGANSFYQLGDGTTTARHAPALASTDSGWTSIVTSESKTCALRNQRLYCWGYYIYSGAEPVVTTVSLVPTPTVPQPI
jgi:hypothetical protein